MTDDEQRPSPDALLAEAKNEHQGKLKIFLGAAPGVGKTFAMLNAAKSKIAEGTDTVIGIVETHRRSETEALAKGIETLPRQKLDYRGLTFEEMDIDAILRRKPKLILVDELAHTNIPGARHLKRYQDVQEILEAGIDVYSTLNIQHIESLNDIVARITGVTVRETVPDTVIQTAATIELIDLPPEELLQRLKDGKVYIPEQARLAINRFFTHGNLTALRELALRQAAARVDEDMTSYMRRHAIAGPWPTSNRIMVCIADDKQATSLVRTARRSAERRQTPWIVLYVETSRHSTLSEAQRHDVAQALELGETMGAEVITVTHENVADEILHVARERNVSTIIIGKSVRSLWSHLVRPSVAAAVLERGDGFDILLMSNSETRRAAQEPRRTTTNETRVWRLDWPSLGKSSIIVLLTTVVAILAGRVINQSFLAFLYLIAVFFAVLDLGLVASLFTTIIGAIALDLLMTLPNFMLLPQRNEDVLAWLFYIVTGCAISVIGDRLYRQTLATKRNAERTQTLYEFTKNIVSAAVVEDVAQVTVGRVAAALHARAVLLLPQNDRLEIVAAVPSDLTLDTASSAAMDWAWRHGKPAGLGSNTLPGAPFFGLPLQAGGNTIGILAVRREEGKPLTADQNHFLSSLAYQAASAIERTKLVSDVAHARLQSETEKLRASLLSSISYDLRAPLDNIIASSRNLSSHWQDLGPERQHELVLSIENEAERLDRFVQNLLDMTELVTGNVRLNHKHLHMRSIINSALVQLTRQVGKRLVRVDIPEDLPLVDGDEKALVRIFVNVIENAIAYSPPTEPVTITAKAKGSLLKITITDNGPGIPESERERIFDMFYRVKNAANLHSVSGIGLGLSICRGFISAHHGTIKATTGEGGKGTSIVIRLPSLGPVTTN